MKAFVFLAGAKGGGDSAAHELHTYEAATTKSEYRNALVL